MRSTFIRHGADAVELQVDSTQVRVRLGRDGIMATVVLDFDEARKLAEAMLVGLRAEDEAQAM